MDSRLWRPLRDCQMHHPTRLNHPHPFGKLRAGQTFPHQDGRLKREVSLLLMFYDNDALTEVKGDDWQWR